jgi:AcrR family transcriptional regulator
MASEAVPAGVDDRRRQILRAAATVIGERGFAETRVNDVARSAGVSSALVIYYFGTRDQLLTAALRHAEDAFYTALEARVAQTDSAAERLRRIVDLALEPRELDEMPGAWVLWLDVLAQAPRHPALGRDRVELDARWRDTVVAVLRHGVERGEFEPVDVEGFGLLLTSALDGLALQRVLDDPLVTVERARAVVADLCRRYLGLP